MTSACRVRFLARLLPCRGLAPPHSRPDRLAPCRRSQPTEGSVNRNILAFLSNGARMSGALPPSLLAIASTVLLFASAQAATYFVDTQNPAASDANPGTAALPFKTIRAAVTQHPGAGNTIRVAPG